MSLSQSTLCELSFELIICGVDGGYYGLEGFMTLKYNFLKLSPPWVAREFLFARRNLVLALTPLFLSQFSRTKVLRTPKIMPFPVISSLLPKSKRKWGLSRANTTPRDKRG
eukprot:sb/3477187/